MFLKDQLTERPFPFLRTNVDVDGYLRFVFVFIFTFFFSKKFQSVVHLLSWRRNATSEGEKYMP